MTELKCPFCGEELDISNPQCVECKNDYCYPSVYGSKELWQALIATKKKLDIAVETIRDVKNDPDTSQETTDYLAYRLEQINKKEQ